MSCRAAQKAFTLIEMLVSLAIVATIMTMVYGSYAATSRTLDVYTSRMTCSEQAHLVLRLMARQIRCAYMPPAASPSSEDQTEPKRALTEPPTAFDAPGRGTRGEILRLTTTAGLGAALDGPVGFSRVAYRYDQAARSLLVSSHSGACNPDSPSDPDAWRPILTGLTSIELGFYDGKHWQVQWNSRQAGRLPQAVKIALTVTDEHGREHPYTTTIPVLCSGASPKQPTRTSGKRP